MIQKPVLRMRDPIFGPLTYEQGLWSFVPQTADEGFVITVDAPEGGPSQMQRDFFWRVRLGLFDFERRAREFVSTRAGATVGVSLLTTYSVEIGDDEESGRGCFVLELSDEQADVIHRVSFEAHEPVDYEFGD